MKHRFFSVLWWLATLALVIVAFGWYTFYDSWGSLPNPSNSPMWPHFANTRIWPLVGIALLYAGCYIGYRKFYRPPRASDFQGEVL